MNLFRRLDAGPNPLHAAYTATTGRTVQDASGDTPAAVTPDWIPVDTTQWQPIFTAMAHHAENPGVTDHAPANPLGH